MNQPRGTVADIYLIVFAVVITTIVEALRFVFSPIRTIKRWRRDGLFAEQVDSYEMITGRRTGTGIKHPPYVYH